MPLSSQILQEKRHRQVLRRERIRNLFGSFSIPRSYFHSETTMSLLAISLNEPIVLLPLRLEIRWVTQHPPATILLATYEPSKKVGSAKAAKAPKAFHAL